MSEVPHRWVGNRDKVTGTKKPEKEEHQRAQDRETLWPHTVPTELVPTCGPPGLLRDDAAVSPEQKMYLT